MRYLVTIEFIDWTVIHLISEFPQTICSYWKGERSFQFYNKYTLSVSLSKSVQFGHLYHKLYNRNWKNSMRKGRIKSPWVSLKCLIRIQFLWRKDHIYTRHFSKHTNKLSQLQNKKIWIYLQLLSSQFTSSTEVKLLTWIHRRLEWIILSVRSLT